MDRIRALRSPIRSYAWGSRTALAELTGRAAPTAEPEAELWMGAHPSAPSEVLTEQGAVSLEEWIRRDPETVLGPEVARRFDGRLPFLFKVLAPETALSIQTHPDAEQARAGFARENAAGLALDAPERNYRDPNPKPEIICALTPFAALCSFRRADEIAAGLGALGVPELEPLLARLAGEGLAAFFRALLSLPPPERTSLAQAAAAAADGSSGEHAWLRELARQHPGDVGVLAPLLLNLIELAPGQALFLPAGELHAYLKGVGVELMANSDNVLRGGLTPKHVDVPELLATLTFREGPPPLLEPGPDGVYASSAREFELAALHLEPGRPVERSRPGGVEILLCTAGAARVCDPRHDETLALARGAAALVPGAAVYRVEAEGGDATLHRAGVPL